MKVLCNHFQSPLHLPVQIQWFPSTARYGMAPAGLRAGMGQDGHPIMLCNSTCKKNDGQTHREMSAFDSKDSFLIQMFYLNDLPLLFYFTLTTLKCSGTEASFTKFLKTLHSFFWDWNTHI